MINLGFVLGSWNYDTIHVSTYSHTHTHKHRYILHKPTLALELSTLICTYQEPRVAQTHQMGHPHQSTPHHSKPQSAVQEQPDHTIRVDSLTTHPIRPSPSQMWMKHPHMTDKFTLESRSLIGSHLSK